MSAGGNSGDARAEQQYAAYQPNAYAQASAGGPVPAHHNGQYNDDIDF